MIRLWPIRKLQGIANPYGLYFVLLSIITLVAGFLLYGLLPGKQEIWMFTNSDTCYMSAIYTDLFVHRSGFSGWHLPASPNFFPDMLFFSLLMAILKGHALTTMVYGVLQLCTLVILINLLLLSFHPKIPVNSLFFLSLVVLILPFSSILGESNLLPSQLLFNGYHCGFFINSLLASIFTLNYLRSGKRIFLGLVATLSLLAVLSDKLYIIGFAGPLLVLLILNYFGSSHRKHYLFLAVTIVLSSLLGLGTFKLLSLSDGINFISTSWKVFNFQNIGGAFSELVIHMKSIIIKAPLQRLLVIMTLVFLAAGPIFLLAYLKKFLKTEEGSPLHRQYNLVLFAALFTYMVFLSPVINGSYVGPAIIRYNYAALIIGSIGFCYLLTVLLSGWEGPRIRPYFAYAGMLLLLLFLLITGLKKQGAKGISDYANYYPESTRILDSLKNEHQLTYGVSEYWQALSNTRFSRNNTRLYTVWDESFRPWYHATNKNWYHDGGKGTHANPVFNYLVVDRFKNTEKLQDLFGSAMDTLYAAPDLTVIKVPDFKFHPESREIYLLSEF